MWFRRTISSESASSRWALRTPTAPSVPRPGRASPIVPMIECSGTPIAVGASAIARSRGLPHSRWSMLPTGRSRNGGRSAAGPFAVDDLVVDRPRGPALPHQHRAEPADQPAGDPGPAVGGRQEDHPVDRRDRHGQEARRRSAPGPGREVQPVERPGEDRSVEGLARVEDQVPRQQAAHAVADDDHPGRGRVFALGVEAPPQRRQPSPDLRRRERDRVARRVEDQPVLVVRPSAPDRPGAR